MIYARNCNVFKLEKAILLGSPYSFKVYNCIKYTIANVISAIQNAIMGDIRSV